MAGSIPQLDSRQKHLSSLGKWQSLGRGRFVATTVTCLRWGVVQAPSHT